MMCVASRTSSPWHNFVTDTEHWEEESGANLCLNDGGIYNHPKVASIQEIGAKNIWIDAKTATFEGSPPPKSKYLLHTIDEKS